MPVTQTQTLPAPFLEAISKEYATGLGDIARAPLPTAGYAPGVVGQQALQVGATTLAGQALPGQAGLGGYQPYLTGAGAAGVAPGAAAQGLAAQGILGAAGTELTGAGTTLGGVSPFISAAETGLGAAGTAMGGAQQYITGAAGLTGAGANLAAAGATPTAGSIAEYMSPYQQQVIDTTLAEFTRQRDIQQQAISDAAVGVGGYGGGRHGVAEAEFMTGTARDRAMIEAQLQQQGFGQAQQARQADMMARLGIGGAQQQYATGLAGLAGQQLGLGGAQQALAGQQAGMAGQRAGLGQQQLGLGQYQMGMGQALQGMAGQDIATMGRVGAMDQAQKQAEADAIREANRMAAYEPMERWGYLGQGIGGMLAGYPAQYQSQIQPNPSPLATALGIASTAGGLYGNIYGPKNPSTVINTR